MQHRGTEKVFTNIIMNMGITTCFALFIALSCASALAQPKPTLKDMENNCESGNAEECINAGTAYSRGELYGKKVKQDKVKSQRLIKRGVRLGEQNCHRGDTKACYVLGILYFEGEVIPPDFPRGLEMIQQSCNGGYEEACVWLQNSGLFNEIK